MMLAFLALALLAVTDVVWLLASSARFAPENFQNMGVVALVLGVWIGILRLVCIRMRHDLSAKAAVLRSLARGGGLFLQAVAFTAAFGWAGGTFICLATSMALPLQDAALASVDRMIGFEWLTFLALANASPIVAQGLVLAYHSAVPQMLLLYLLLSFTGRTERLAEFLALFCVTFSITALVMLLVPAAGAYAYYQPGRHLFDGFSADAGMWHYQTLLMLRTEAAPLIAQEHIKGLVTFPSFHTALAIVTAYAARGIRMVALPAVVLNGVVVVSTLPEGGHFLVDVLAGALVAAAAIGLVRWEKKLERYRHAAHPPLHPRGRPA